MLKYTASELTDLIAVITIALALFFCIYLGEKELSFTLAGTLGGVLGVTTKNKLAANASKGDDK